MRKEADVKAEVKKVMSRVAAKYNTPIWWFMPAANGYGRPGIPDFIGCVHGFSFAIETKFGGGKQTPHQVREATHYLSAGGRLYLVNENNLGEFTVGFDDWVGALTALEK